MSDRPTLSLRHPEPEVRAAQASEGARVRMFDDGAWVIYRLVPDGFARAARPPKFRHQTLEAAQAEARRLAALHPESKFVLLQERGLVSMRRAA